MPDPIRDYADKAIREALLEPENLRDLVRARVPHLVDALDFTRVRLVPPEFLLPDGRGREADLLFEIPCRVGDGERTALVCVLIEHQTRPDPRMALRTLLYVVLYWERQWSAWEAMPAPKPAFTLPPVLPIVFHTGTRPWGSAKSIAELLGEPSAFHPFAPSWSPLFWELSERSVDELLSADEAFLRALAVVRVEDAELAEFEQVFRETWKRLAEVQDENRIRWSHLLNLIVGWLIHRRPPQEQPELMHMAEKLVQQERYKPVIQRPLKRSIADAMREDAVRPCIVRLGVKRFGPVPPDAEAALNAIEDWERLERILDRILDAASWADLVGTP